METINIYAIWDRKGERYDTPQFIPSDIFAKRWFYKLIMDGQGQLKHFKDDFELHSIGSFNVITGVLEQLDKNIIIDGKQIDRKEIENNEISDAA